MAKNVSTMGGRVEAGKLVKTEAEIGNERGDRGDVSTAGRVQKVIPERPVRQATHSLSFAFSFSSAAERAW